MSVLNPFTNSSLYSSPNSYQSQNELQNQLENSLQNQPVNSQLEPSHSSSNADISKYVNNYLNIEDTNREEIKQRLIEFIKCQLGTSTKYQYSVFSTALAEIQKCKKTTHWIWYVIPSYTNYPASSPITKYFCINNPNPDYSPVMVSHYLMIPYLKNNYETIITAINTCISKSKKSINDILSNSDDIYKFYNSINVFLKRYNELKKNANTTIYDDFIKILTELNKLNPTTKTVKFSTHTPTSGGSYKLTKKNNGK
jgi:uncharacterized protein (DUF1810 family)